MLRRSPGRVVFGRELARLDFEKRKVEAKRKARYRKDLSGFHARMKIEDAKRERMMKKDDRWQEK